MGLHRIVNDRVVETVCDPEQLDRSDPVKEESEPFQFSLRRLFVTSTIAIFALSLFRKWWIPVAEGWKYIVYPTNWLLAFFFDCPMIDVNVDKLYGVQVFCLFIGIVLAFALIVTIGTITTYLIGAAWEWSRIKEEE